MDKETIELLLTAVERPPEKHGDLAAFQRRMVHLRVVFTVAALVVYLGALADAGVMLWQACHGAAWSPFWDAVKSAWSMSALTPICTLFTAGARLAGQAHVLRTHLSAQAMHRDSSANDQPQPLAPGEISIGSESLGPFERLDRWRISGVVTALVLSLLFAAGFGLVATLLLIGRSPTPAEVVALTLGLGLPGAIFLSMGVFAMRRLRRFRSPLVVRADDWGLEWEMTTGRERRAHLAWHEARLFFAIREPDVADDAYSVFVVRGDGARLVWALPGAPSAEQRAANERLCRLIVTRTRLPLVVISAATLSPEDYGVVELEPSPIDPPMSAGVARFFWLAFLGPFLVTLLLSGFGALLQHGWLPR